MLMKKTIMVQGGDMIKDIFRILILIAVIGLLLNCGQKSDLAVRYEMEKKLSEADYLQEQYSLKSSGLTKGDLSDLVRAYQDVTDMAALPVNSDEIKTASKELQESWSLALLANTRIGILYQNHREYDKAYDFFGLVAACPTADSLQVATVLYFMAICKESAGKYEEASALYDSLAEMYATTAVARTPNLNALSAPIKSAEMWLLMNNKDKHDLKLEQARTYYNKLREKFPGTPLEFTAIGKIVATYLRQNRHDKGIDVLKTAKDKETGLLSPNILLMIADIQMNQTRQHNEVEKTYREFIRLYPEHEKLGQVRFGLGLSLYKQGKYPQARKAVKDIQRIPRISSVVVAEAYFLVALCYEKEDRWEKAIGQFDLIQGTFPGTDKAFEAGLYVANRYSEKGQTKLAMQSYNETAEYIKKYTNPETSNPVSTSRALGYLIRCYTEIGDYEKAVENLILSHERYPELPEGRLAPLRLADMYEVELKDNKKAIEWLIIYLQKNPYDKNKDKITTHIDELKKQ